MNWIYYFPKNKHEALRIWQIKSVTVFGIVCFPDWDFRDKIDTFNLEIMLQSQFSQIINLFGNECTAFQK